jgi:hypothetical protein
VFCIYTETRSGTGVVAKSNYKTVWIRWTVSRVWKLATVGTSHIPLVEVCVCWRAEFMNQLPGAVHVVNDSSLWDVHSPQIIHNTCSNHRKTSCFMATEGLHSPSHTTPYHMAKSHQYRVASFAALRILSSRYSPGLCCSCCNVVRFSCDLEACNLVTATVVSFNA